MATRLIRILVTQCLSLVIIAVSLNPTVACQAILLEGLGISQSRGIEPNVEQEHPGMRVYLNSPSEIHIISDRQENVVEFFQRHRIVVGMATVQDLNKIIPSQVMPENFFVAYPSSNDDGSGKIGTYRLSFKLAPVSLEVIQIWKNRHQPNAVSVHIFLERDPLDSELYHFVGWAESNQFSFTPEDSIPFPLNPQELWYKGGSN
jgi:hypothetical protein